VYGSGGVDMFDEATRNFVQFTPRLDNTLGRDCRRALLSESRLSIVQPVMIGRLDLCRRLKDAINDGVLLTEFRSETGYELGVLRVPYNGIGSPDIETVAGAYVTPRI
jgi:hypothetical protein